MHISAQVDLAYILIWFVFWGQKHASNFKNLILSIFAFNWIYFIMYLFLNMYFMEYCVTCVLSLVFLSIVNE